MESELLPINDELVIPLAELQFRFSRSSGPGGQHVQKSSTRVELYFDVVGSPSLNEEQRSRILTRLAGYIDTVGLLRLVAQSERSQLRNRQEVTERFQELLRTALRRRRAACSSSWKRPVTSCRLRSWLRSDCATRRSRPTVSM